jgi:hypothetical protein
VETKFENHTIKLLISEHEKHPSSERACLSFDKEKTYLFGDDWLIE